MSTYGLELKVHFSYEKKKFKYKPASHNLLGAITHFSSLHSIKHFFELNDILPS